MEPANVMASAVLLNIGALTMPPREMAHDNRDSGLSAVIAHATLEPPKNTPAHREKKAEALSDTKVQFKDGELSGPYGKVEKGERPLFKNLIFINGIDTDSKRAVKMAEKTSECLKSPTLLIYNHLNPCDADDTWLEEAAGWIEKRIALAVEKTGDYDWSLNEATETILQQVQQVVGRGEEVYLVAHSAGALCVMNALREFDALSADKTVLAKVHVLTVGSAVFSDEHVLSDGWPKDLGSVHHLFDPQDPVVQIVGPGEFGCGDEKYHNYIEHYGKYLKPEQLRSNGKTIVNTEK